MSSYSTVPQCRSVGRPLTDAFVDLYFMNYITTIAADAVPYLHQSPQYSAKTCSFIAKGPTTDSLPTLSSFIRTLVIAFKLPRVVMITSAVYLGRWRFRHPGASGTNPSAPYCLVLTSMIIAVKQLYDNPPPNARWVRFLQKSGIHYFTLEQINSMEIEMLYDLSWNVQMSSADVRRVSEPVLFVLGDELLDYAQQC
ncbi:cyclin [Fusarium circinatum]|uniref:Cyclin n=1 Tax=Fusarium circinatum TaxID=48490 RepID=A0A8H5X5I1_FUSCI|nr:cyclin [Fusarium circinatum]